MTPFYPWFNFFLFTALLVYFLRTPLLDFLGDRSESLRRELETIARRLREAQDRLKEYRQKMNTAHQEIETLKKEFQQEGEAEKRRLIQKAQTYSEKIREDAKRMAEQEFNKARDLLKRKAFLLAIDLAKKKLEAAMEPADQIRLTQWGIQHLEKGENEIARLS